METFGIWQVIALILGSAGISGFITSLINLRKAPTEIDAIEASLTQALTDSAKELVVSQASVLAGRDAEIESLRNRVDSLEMKLQKVLTELENERMLREERERELEHHRFDIAKQNEKIGYLRRRVNAFAGALRKAGIDPDIIETEIEEIEKE